MAREDGVSTKYFRTQILGLRVVVGEPGEGQVAPETIRFKAYEIQQQLGEPMKFAYLATDNPIAIQILTKDHNVVEVKKDEYDKYTDLKSTEPKIKLARM